MFGLSFALAPWTRMLNADDVVDGLNMGILKIKGRTKGHNEFE